MGSFGIVSSGRQGVVLHGVRFNVGIIGMGLDKEREEKESSELFISPSLFVY